MAAADPQAKTAIAIADAISVGVVQIGRDDLLWQALYFLTAFSTVAGCVSPPETLTPTSHTLKDTVLLEKGTRI